VHRAAVQHAHGTACVSVLLQHGPSSLFDCVSLLFFRGLRKHNSDRQQERDDGPRYDVSKAMLCSDYTSNAYNV
jgi:hypothetical protein